MTTADHDPWRGYSLDELRFRRILARSRIESEKPRLQAAGENTLATLPSIGRSATRSLIRSLNLIDYAFLAFRLYRRFSSMSSKKE